MIPWRAVAPIIAVVALIAAVVFVLRWTYGAGHDAGASSVRAEYEQRLAAERRTHTAALIAAERQAAADMAGIADRYQGELANAKADAARLAAAVRDGQQRLRERFTCPATGVPAAGDSAGGSDEGAQRGLQRADADFLIRLAAEADEVTLQLRACQAVIRSDRKAISVPSREW